MVTLSLGQNARYLAHSCKFFMLVIWQLVITYSPLDTLVNTPVGDNRRPEDPGSVMLAAEQHLAAMQYHSHASWVDPANAFVMMLDTELEAFTWGTWWAATFVGSSCRCALYVHTLKMHLQIRYLLFVGAYNIFVGARYITIKSSTIWNDNIFKTILTLWIAIFHRNLLPPSPISGQLSITFPGRFHRHSHHNWQIGEGAKNARFQLFRNHVQNKSYFLKY